MIGTCKLCLIPGLELRGSHYIPKAVYRQLRDVTSSSNPNPWSIDKATSVQTSRQLSAPLLCETCEGRFSKFGEDWILRHFLKADGGFRLASILAVHKPSVHADGNATRVYLAGDIPESKVLLRTRRRPPDCGDAAARGNRAAGRHQVFAGPRVETGGSLGGNTPR